MINSNPQILVLSSCSPTMGPAIIGEQIYEALKQKGVDVDFMTKYPEPGHPEYLWVVKNNYLNRVAYKIRRKIEWSRVGNKPNKDDHYFFYTYENRPPVPSRLVMEAIRKQYDMVIVVFWQELLSFESVERIYDKLHCLMYFTGVDYSQMSGGCHFTGDCQGYKTGCGMCPAFNSHNKNDFTAWNVRYRMRFYEKVKPVVGGNLYMNEFYKKSYLLRNARIEIGEAPIIDTDVFRPLDKASLFKEYDISVDKKHIIFFGCQKLADERKGIKYLLEAFHILYEWMDNREAKQVLVITAGRQYEEIKDSIPFDSIGFGYIPMNQLPELYSMATLFVCPSINDAGPMMVNQSLSCGTPVVGFDMGAIKQVVKDKGSGICVPLRDSKALAKGMHKIIKMSNNEYLKMSERAREIALQTSSYEAQADAILSIYEKYGRPQ